MLRALLCCLLASFSWTLACKDKADDSGAGLDGGGPDGGGADGGGSDGGSSDGGGADCVPTADGELVGGLQELSWDDGEGPFNIPDQGWTVGEYDLAMVPMHEWVRFEAQGDMRVHGVSVQLAGLPEDPEAPVTVGLYPDFGYNGFDAWHPEPLWQGTLCAGDLDEGQWVQFVVDPPVEVAAGSLVYAGHLREGEGGPALLLDDTVLGDGSCAAWDDCHSAFNLPEATTLTSGGVTYGFWKGYTSPLANDYLVRLQVDADPPLPAEDLVFSPVVGGPVGSRQAFGDYDGDGWEDLYIPGALMQNQGDGSFVDASEAAGLSAMGIPSSGGVWGDYDNDGCLDLLIFAESYTAGETLLHNECDGTFTNATASSGLQDSLDGSDACSATHASTAAAAWWDLDGDGLLDLYLSNFICWTDYSYYEDQVFRNQGDGTFAELTGTSGFTSVNYAGRGASPVDRDLDGDVDLLVNNYVLQRNLYYENDGDGTVVDRSLNYGLGGQGTSYYGYLYYGHTIGAAWGDLDNDGDWDSVQTNLAHPRYFDFSDKTQILIQGDDGVHVDNAGTWETPFSDNGLRYQETHSVPALADWDSDGFLDLAISAVYDGRPTDLYWGLGDGTFAPAWAESGISTENGWAMASADVDQDGDLDLATSGGFFVNQREQGHWVEIRAIGDVSSNRAGLGAVVIVTDAGGKVRMGQAQGGTGQGGQDSLFLHFGLGGSDEVATIELRFIGGEHLLLHGPWPADQRIWISESGQVQQGSAPPDWYGPTP